jgi:hypothetical protein
MLMRMMLNGARRDHVMQPNSTTWPAATAAARSVQAAVAVGLRAMMNCAGSGL